MTAMTGFGLLSNTGRMRFPNQVFLTCKSLDMLDLPFDSGSRRHCSSLDFRPWSLRLDVSSAVFVRDVNFGEPMCTRREPIELIPSRMW